MRALRRRSCPRGLFSLKSRAQRIHTLTLTPSSRQRARPQGHRVSIARISWGRAQRGRWKRAEPAAQKGARARGSNAAPPHTPQSSLRRKLVGGGHSEVAGRGPSLRRRKARGQRGGSAAPPHDATDEPAAQITWQGHSDVAGSGPSLRRKRARGRRRGSAAPPQTPQTSLRRKTQLGEGTTMSPEERRALPAQKRREAEGVARAGAAGCGGAEREAHGVAQRWLARNEDGSRHWAQQQPPPPPPPPPRQPIDRHLPSGTSQPAIRQGDEGTAVG